MTRKDYILIARALRETIAEAQDWTRPNWRAAVIEASHKIASQLECENPRFDYAHFLAVVRGEKALTSRPPR